MRNRTLQIDIAKRKFKALSYKQYDSNNELDIVVYENKVLVDISNYIAKVYFELPSGKNYVIDGTIKNNTIHALIPKVVLSEWGQVTVECELRSFDIIITSFAFYFNVEKSIDKDGVQNPNVEHTHENKDTLDRITDNMVDMMELNMGTVNLDSYQLKRDTELDTDDKTIVGAINELNEKIENIDTSGSNGNTNVNLDEYAKKTEIPTKTSQLTNDSNFLTSVPSQYITESELNTALSNYAKKSEVPQQPNFTFKINMVSEGQEATVVTSGTYPNMTFTFNIPQGTSSGGEVEPEPAVERMWIGYLPYDPNGVVGIDSLDVIGVGLTKKYIDGAVQGGTLKEVNVSTYGKTSVGIVPESAYICCIYPASQNFTVTIDNGLGGKETINEKYGDYPVNALPLNSQIGGISYKISGFLTSMEGERFLYVD